MKSACQWLCLTRLCRLEDTAAARQLLELGADPNAGAFGAIAPFTIWGHKMHGPIASQLLEMLLHAGANCLLCNSLDDVSCLPRLAGTDLGKPLFVHLEQQLAAGQLQPGSDNEAFELLHGAMKGGHSQLLSHGISCLEGLLAAAGGGRQADYYTDDDGNGLLSLALKSPASTAIPALQALLASQLPFDLDDREGFLLVEAARHTDRDTREAAVPLLHQAGVPLTLEALLHVVVSSDSDIWAEGIDPFRPEGVALLLSRGRPAVDVTKTSMRLSYSEQAYTCPIHALLRKTLRAEEP